MYSCFYSFKLIKDMTINMHGTGNKYVLEIYLEIATPMYTERALRHLLNNWIGLILVI
jgi:hypothetical protein